jgi:hypothetical protein
MKKATSSDELRRLIDLVEVQLCMVPDWKYEDRDSWGRHHAGLSKMVDHLIEREGGRFGKLRLADRFMTLGGIRTSCTSGLHGLFTNWINAARREIDARQESAS